MSEIKTENPWFNHVINWGDNHNMTYTNALYDTGCKFAWYEMIDELKKSNEKLINDKRRLIDTNIIEEIIEYQINKMPDLNKSREQLAKAKEEEQKAKESLDALLAHKPDWYSQDSTSDSSSVVTNKKKKKLKLGGQVSQVYQKKYIKLLEKLLKDQRLEIIAELENIRQLI
jgi:hypothetical protein